MKYLEKLNKEANRITTSVKTFHSRLWSYIDSWPSIKSDGKRWLLNILYFAIGLLYNWAVSAILRQMPNMHQFPSTVAGMIVLFFALVFSHAWFPTFTDNIVLLIDPYSSFALRSMNIMFVPAVTQIINNPPTAGSEIGRMFCVFFVAYIIGFVVCTLLVRFWRVLLFNSFWKIARPQGSRNTDEEQVEAANAMPTSSVESSSSEKIINAIDNSAESTSSSSSSSSSGTPTLNNRTTSNDITELCEQPTKRYGPLHDFVLWCMSQSTFDDVTLFIAFCISAFVFLPLPNDSAVMPFVRLVLYFTMTILLYSAALRVPAKAKLLIHPVLLVFACTMAGIGYFERAKGLDIKQGIHLYKAGITFIGLVERTNVGWPGAGDILSAAMDVSVISLAFNVYKSRPGSFREWAIVFFSIVPMAILIMFITPLFAHGIGCTPGDSLAWSSRSVTTAIGIVIGNVLGANQSIVICIIVFTGIMGPLLGPYLLKLAHVREDDYMTIGITMGGSSHGVGTAYLIVKTPEASGMASIAFAMFGTVGVIVASVPALSQVIKQLSGL